MKKLIIILCLFFIEISGVYADIFTPESKEYNRKMEAMKCNSGEVEVSCSSGPVQRDEIDYCGKSGFDFKNDPKYRFLNTIGGASVSRDRYCMYTPGAESNSTIFPPFSTDASNNVYIASGIGGIIVLSILGLVYIRRKNRAI